MSTETLERIRSIGMDLTRTLEKIRVATGTIEQDRLTDLEHTVGVESVEVSRAVTALPAATTDVTV